MSKYFNHNPEFLIFDGEWVDERSADDAAWGVDGEFIDVLGRRKIGYSFEAAFEEQLVETQTQIVGQEANEGMMIEGEKNVWLDFSGKKKEDVFHALQRRFRLQLYKAVSMEDISRISEKLMEQAMQGHLPAVKLLFEYLMGKPPQAVEAEQTSEKVFEVKFREAVVGEAKPKRIIPE